MSSLESGTLLGNYEILVAIGAGGMGEVYRARDTRLKRDVAIKSLPSAFAQDPDRIARFQREAQVLASLNHPNIAAIYDVQELHGSQFLVMELVEGETLGERLARGSLRIDEALEFAKQIALALEAAHEKGILHRDLKPANIKVTPDGRVKVLDFGLAKLLEPSSGEDTSLSNSPTMLMSGTLGGVILGTTGYMSPEQARGQQVDRTSDVWAFGCVLYEMLSGRRAFEGESVSDVLGSVLKVEPDWNALPAGTPPDLRKLLRTIAPINRLGPKIPPALPDE
jgi:serine/threonine protein kinase